MIKRRKMAGTDTVKVSFILPAADPRLPASVVGEFNEWDPRADPMVKRSNNTCSAVVPLRSGAAHRFRYRSDDGSWFDEDMADGHELNVHGSTDCIIVV